MTPVTPTSRSRKVHANTTSSGNGIKITSIEVKSGIPRTVTFSWNYKDKARARSSALVPTVASTDQLRLGNFSLIAVRARKANKIKSIVLNPKISTCVHDDGEHLGKETVPLWSPQYDPGYVFLFPPIFSICVYAPFIIVEELTPRYQFPAVLIFLFYKLR